MLGCYFFNRQHETFWIVSAHIDSEVDLLLKLVLVLVGERLDELCSSELLAK
jgi:hypothetical protein